MGHRSTGIGSGIDLIGNGSGFGFSSMLLYTQVNGNDLLVADVSVLVC